jgi:hypothetical protein
MSNNSSIIMGVFIAAGIYLPSCSLAMIGGVHTQTHRESSLTMEETYS